MSAHPIFAETLRAISGVAPEAKFVESVMPPVDVAITRILELEQANASLQAMLAIRDKAITSLATRLEDAAPSDYELDLVEIYGGQPESRYVMAPESVVVEATKQLRNRHALEFADFLESEYHLQMANANKP